MLTIMQVQAQLPEHAALNTGQTNTLCSKYLRCKPVTRKQKKQIEVIA